ncbi:hypothetical protein GLYMA_16G192666v4 [Glycine max]|nr:hypothetical protein GLYMA_16G192666v4 [Glycine max]
MNPKCHQADSDIVHKGLAQYPFQRTKLQQICVGFFEWPSEKTDGYILPSIAERNLRRFANLRLTSSEVGMNLPLHEQMALVVHKVAECQRSKAKPVSKAPGSDSHRVEKWLHANQLMKTKKKNWYFFFF